MKRKSKLFRILMVFCFALLLTNCAVEELKTSQTAVQTTNVEIAKNWFEQYKSATEFNSNFKNVKYDWENAKTETLENDSQAIVVPVYDFKENQDFTVKNFLYFYPTDGTTFETTLYELKSSTEPLDGQSLAESLRYFTGYINVWNLEKGFIESTKFENSIAKATFSGEENSVFSLLMLLEKWLWTPQYQVFV